jgi:hypothetical protein
MDLTQEQTELLQRLVEEWRALPRERRSQFLTPPYDGRGSQVLIVLPNPSKFHLQAYEGDVNTLIERGLLRPGYGSHGLFSIDLTNEAFRIYEDLMRRAEGPTERIEETVRRYITHDTLRSRYPEAHAKLLAAEELLWGLESESSLTTIGHLCREGVQLFASRLVTLHAPPSADSDPAKTLNRIRSVLDLYPERIGTRENEFLASLFGYAQALNGLVQRQEHGSQAAERPLTWDDGRRVVFYTWLLFLELDHTLRRARPEI